MKIKQTISIMLVLAMTLVMLPITAQAATDGYYTYSVKDDVAIITDVDNSIIGDVVIPDKFVVDGVGEYPVVEIGYEAFYNCDNITSIVIPKGVEIIGNRSFYGCDTLANVSIPNTVTLIGDAAFQRTALVSVIIPDSVNTIAGSAFRECVSLKEVVLPKSFQFDGGHVFYGCEALEYVTLPYGITSLGNGNIFARCTSLYQITIPGTLSEIPNSCFSGCTSLSDVTIEEGVQIIGDSAFLNCTALEQITLPKSISGIGESSFSGTVLREINLPDNMEYIDRYAFSYCSYLTEVTIPYSITNINKGIFNNCSNLQFVTIFDSVESIYSNNFSGCNENLIFQCFDESVAEKYAEKNGFICKYITRDITDAAANITLSTAMESFHADGASFSSTRLNEQISEITQDHTLYSMEYLVDGTPSSQKYEMTFTVPVPQDYNGQNCKVYLVENGQKSTEIKTKYLSYEEVLKFSVADPNGTFVIVNEGLPGDATADGIVNLKDVVTMIRYLAGYDVTPDEALSDVTGDGTVNLKDVVMLIRYLAGYPVELV